MSISSADPGSLISHWIPPASYRHVASPPTLCASAVLIMREPHQRASAVEPGLIPLNFGRSDNGATRSLAGLERRFTA